MVKQTIVPPTRILIINPNSDDSMTRLILESARRCASPDTRVDCVSTPEAPIFIENYLDELQCGPGMVDIGRRESGDYDAFIVACHSDVNLDVLREIIDKPVVGIGQASMHAAAMLGHRFSVIQTTDHSVPMKEDLVRRYGLWEKCASVRAVVGNSDSLLGAVAEAAQRAVGEDGAEVIVLGCAGLSGLEKEIERRVGVPVVDGVACAVVLVEGLVRCGLTTSKVRKYRPE